jgi:hypothetical protein
LIGARFRLGGDSVRLTVADPGNPAREYELPIPDVELRAVVPAGAADLEPFIAGTRFEVTREIDGDLEKLEAGSAVVVTYTAELVGLHAMFIPPLAPDIAQDGLSVYAESPEIADATPARREEQVTLVFESGGEFTIPAARFDWWNTAISSVETIVLDAVSITVEGPTPLDAAGEEPETQGWQGWAVGAGLILLAALLARFSMPRLLAWYRHRQARIRASEAYAFKTLLASFRNGDTRTIHAALLGWVARIDAGLDSRGFAATYGDPELLAAVDSIIQSRFGEPATGDAPNHDLGRRLAAARKRYLGTRDAADGGAIPRLNP